MGGTKGSMERKGGIYLWNYMIVGVNPFDYTYTYTNALCRYFENVVTLKFVFSWQKYVAGDSEI